MLKKLLKYELPVYLKFLFVFYVLAVFFSILTRVFLHFGDSLVMMIVGEIFRGAAISMMCSALINNFMRLLVGFTRGLYGDTSYLLHTLPVSKRAMYGCKMVSVLLTTFITFLVCIGSLLIMFGFRVLKEFIDSLTMMFASGSGITFGMLVCGMILLLILEFINILQCGFSGVILGHKRPDRKNISSFFYGAAVFMAVQMVVLVAMAALALCNREFMEFFTKNIMPGTKTLSMLMWSFSVVYAVLITLVWRLNVKLLEKGVDVE